MALTIGGKKENFFTNKLLEAQANNPIANVLQVKLPATNGAAGNGNSVGGTTNGVTEDPKSVVARVIPGANVLLGAKNSASNLGEKNSASNPGTEKKENPYDAAVAESAAKLAGAEGAAPKAYQSGYQPQIDNLLNSILTMKKFNYNMDADPLYQQYKNQYMRQGSQAMRDTMGQAAALTGGYGSSYASTAGNQAYQKHLGQMNEVAPQLYQAALNAYEARNSRLQSQLSALQAAENQAYGRWQDQYSRWLDDRDYWYQKNKDDQTRRDNWKG